MVDIPTSLTVGIVATFVPLIIGIIFPKGIARLWKHPDVNVWLIAFSAGIIFWFFIDVMGDAAQLDVNQGFGGDYTHVALASAFALGIIVLFALEKQFTRTRTRLSTVENSQLRSIGADITFAIAAVAALGIGFHAMGEGMDIGASLPTASDILSAIGGFYPGVAYVLHKFLEGFVIGTFALVAGATRLRHIGILTLISGVPTLIGFFIGLPNLFDSSYLFALGGAGAVYVEMKFITVLSRSVRFYISIAPLLLGFYAMYTAGLFHG